MKKILSGTTALIAVGLFAASAQAADPIKLSVGGFMNQWFGYVSQESEPAIGAVAPTEPNNFANTTDTQVHFSGETELDNGLTVAVTIEKEAERSQNAINNSNANQQYVTLSGGFGEVTMGEVLIVQDRLHNAAPRYGIPYDVLGGLLLAPQAGAIGSYAATSLDAVNGAGTVKLEYVTPELFGLTAGVSYTPNWSAQGRNIANEHNTDHDFLAAAVAYNAEYENGVTVAADVGVGRGEYSDAPTGAANTSNTNAASGYVTGISTGLNVGLSGFTVGGAYMRLYENFNGNQDGVRTVAGTAYDVGVGYEGDGFGLAVTYYRDEREDNVTTANKNRTSHILLSGTYDLGPGIAYQATLGQSDIKNAARTDTGTTKATYFINGITLEF